MMDDRSSEIVFGRNAVAEVLRSSRPVDSILVARGERTGSLVRIVAQAREKGLVVKEVDSKKLDYLSAHGNHQGIAASCAVKEYSTVEDILAYARERGEEPFVVVCEGIEDPHNLGAVIRTAEAAGVHGVIVPQRHSAPLSFAVEKASAGAVEYMRVARVVNITALLKQLKKEGLWIYCADMDGTPYDSADISGAVAILIGSEGSGVSRLAKENCDFCLSIPMSGRINSLNASVAAGILIFEAAKKRRG